VQAYDAELALQYSVGLDPIPSVDPLPWQAWRIQTANVDGIGDIMANDAAKILKYTAGLIEIFPVEGKSGSVSSYLADISITYEEGELLFRSSGELFGLNVFVHENHDILGEPEILNSEMLKATNIGEGNYAIGLATAHSPEENELFMKVPVSAPESMSITLDMFVNEAPKTVTISVTSTGIGLINGQTLIYPNPVYNKLYVSGIEVNSTVSIYDLTGSQRLSVTVTSATQEIDVGMLEKGIYILKVQRPDSRRTSKFMKQ
jgi:hypothetical protein